jgi:hypothetical protein
MPQCTQCNAGLSADAKFCGRCGAAAPRASEAASPLSAAASYPPPSSPPSPPSSPSPPTAPHPAWAAAPTQGPAQAWGAGQGYAGAPRYPAPGVPTAPRPTAGGAVAGGIMAIAGAIGTAAACWLPLSSTTGIGGPSVSLFKQLGNGQGWWFLVEPLGVAVLAVVAGIIVMAAHGRALPVAAAGVLLGFGIQTVFLWLGYWRGFEEGQHTGPAGIVGLLAGVLITVAGLVAGSALARRQT